MADPVTYSMVSVPKGSNNQGQPDSKKNIVIIFDFDKVTAYTRDAKGVTITALTLASPATPIGLFVNERTIDAGDEMEGDDYERGWLHHFNFHHPGSDLAFAEFKANNANANLGAISISCDPAVTTAKVYGTPCAPLKMQKADLVDNNEANRQEVELKSSARTFPAGIIAKSLIPVTDNADINTFLGLTAGV